jgi:hypothetical protein
VLALWGCTDVREPAGSRTSAAIQASGVDAQDACHAQMGVRRRDELTMEDGPAVPVTVALVRLHTVDLGGQRRLRVEGQEQRIRSLNALVGCSSSRW